MKARKPELDTLGSLNFRSYKKAKLFMKCLLPQSVLKQILRKNNY